MFSYPSLYKSTAKLLLPQPKSHKQQTQVKISQTLFWRCSSSNSIYVNYTATTIQCKKINAHSKMNSQSIVQQYCAQLWHVSLLRKHLQHGFCIHLFDFFILLLSRRPPIWGIAPTVVVCELARVACYLIVDWPSVELLTPWSLVQHANQRCADPKIFESTSVHRFWPGIRCQSASATRKKYWSVRVCAE